MYGMPVAGADLADVLGEVFRDRPTKLPFLKVAADRAYHDVIETMDLAREAGVPVLALVPREQLVAVVERSALEWRMRRS
jgi:biopolymer transport protein ExbD